MATLVPLVVLKPSQLPLVNMGSLTWPNFTDTMVYHVLYGGDYRGRRGYGFREEDPQELAEEEEEQQQEEGYVSQVVDVEMGNKFFKYQDTEKMTIRDVDVPIPEAPRAPYPITTANCDVICGFGRGSSELGIPTANVPMSQLPELVNKLELGVYFGYAKLAPHEDKAHEEEVERHDGRKVTYNYGKLLEQENGDLDILPVVLSVGKNPFYNNDYKTVEIHVLHDFHHNFYGARIKFNILGYIRPELNYTTKEALIEDINTDIDIARQVLDTEHYRAHMADLI